jgi:hypothetical protein
MQRGDALVVHADRHGLRGLQEALGPVGELFEIHGISPFQVYYTTRWVAARHKARGGRALTSPGLQAMERPWDLGEKSAWLG